MYYSPVRMKQAVSNIFVSPVSRMARICSLTFSVMALTNFPAGIDTVDHIQTGAVVPVHQNVSGIVDTVHGAFGANGRSLHVIHPHKLHAAADRILLFDMLHDFS